jgi:hypothetical protein
MPQTSQPNRKISVSKVPQGAATLQRPKTNHQTMEESVERRGDGMKAIKY